MVDEADIRKMLFTLGGGPMAQGSGGANIAISEAELRAIRQLPDVNLVEVLSEISERGWDAGKRKLAAVLVALEEQD